MGNKKTQSGFAALAKVRKSKRKIVSITAYDYPSGRLADEAGVDMILVGDSLGMVVAGLPDTTGVTIDQMVYHTEMVARGVKESFLVSDLPYHTYDTPKEAIKNGRRLIQAGAQAVKLEGGTRQIDKVIALTDEGIPVVAHIGMLPQRVREEGGYKKKGKSDAEVQYLIQSAHDLQEAGAGAVVLESMLASVATRITKELRIPTIGIGAGEDCDGQIRVLHDVIGGYPWFVPPFAKPHADVAGEMRRAIDQYSDDVQAGDS